ncbi:hypothetical protein [Halostella litorea]|uniref:hypothetical protein n=1 Tax=Halostella litorea TaxID=2528831 RepID=UPI001092BC73|nr:hypothetical protein [Halostella litorea]
MAEGDEDDSDGGRTLPAYLGVAGLASLCCVGVGTVVGGAAVAGGAGTVTAAAGGANVVGSLISGLVTLATVAAVGLVVRWRLRS